MDNHFFTGFMDELLKIAQGILSADVQKVRGKLPVVNQTRLKKTPMETPPKGPEEKKSSVVLLRLK